MFRENKEYLLFFLTSTLKFRDQLKCQISPELKIENDKNSVEDPINRSMRNFVPTKANFNPSEFNVFMITFLKYQL